MASRWANWSTGTEEKGLSLNGFLAEQTATEEAHGMGLHSVGYGWWADKSGQVVARTKNGRLEMIEGDGPTGSTGPTTAATTDMGNPTGAASGLTPADKARSMGLQSNGSGGYVDQEGNTIARTVNNELVFYDSRASGGAVSDGSGGEQLTQSQPSWVDPVTGLIITPPAQPESPEEIDATPDPVPAQAPAGFDAIMNKMKLKAYEDRAVQTEVENEVAGLQAEVDEKYASSPELSRFKDTMNIAIEKGMESGDPYKIETATIALDNLNNDVDEYMNIYNSIEEDPEAQRELTRNLRKKVILQARKDLHFRKREEIQADESMSPEEKRDATMLLLDDETYGEHTYAPLDEINNTIQQIQEFTREKLDQQNQIPGGTGEEWDIPGERVTYTVQDIDEKGRGKFFNTAKRAAVKVAKENGMEQPTNVKAVKWDGEQTGDSDEDRKTAIDALRTWRNQVLPSMENGTLVVNYPQQGGRGDNQRERIYSLAGFGEYDEGTEGQYGLVIQDEEGNNQLIPVDISGTGTKRKKRINKLKEDVLIALNYELNTQQEILIYESLFQ